MARKSRRRRGPRRNEIAPPLEAVPEAMVAEARDRPRFVAEEPTLAESRPRRHERGRGRRQDGDDLDAPTSTCGWFSSLARPTSTDFVIKKSEISIGREARPATSIITDKKSSRKHLIIKRVGMNFVAQDLGSANGTTINGNKFTEQEARRRRSLSGSRRHGVRLQGREPGVLPAQEQAQRVHRPSARTADEASPDQAGMGLDATRARLQAHPIRRPRLPIGRQDDQQDAGFGRDAGAFPASLGGAQSQAARSFRSRCQRTSSGKLKHKWRQLPPKKQKLYAAAARRHRRDLAMMFTATTTTPPKKVGPAPEAA